MSTAPRVLFVLRKGQSYGSTPDPYATAKPSGLTYATEYTVQMLNQMGITADYVEVFDNNFVDDVVREYNPTHVIIEAFWVTPAKFDELLPLHPGVNWTVRDHSETAFLALEGIGFDWTAEYLKRGITIMTNSPRSMTDMATCARGWGLSPKIAFGPCYYPVPDPDSYIETAKTPANDYVDVGCFGAIRPLKNTMSQAIAAVSFAESVGRKLRFHINSSRVECNGDPVLKSLRTMFSHSHHELVEHDWMDRSTFLSLATTMDIVMQVSLTETFNVVAADAMSVGVPLVVSSEVPWIGPYAHASPVSVPEMAQRMIDIFCENQGSRNRRINRQMNDMTAYNEISQAAWYRFFNPK